MQNYQNPNYFNPYQQFGGYNPMLNAQQRMQQLEQQYPQFSQQNLQMQQLQQIQQNAPQILNGKIVSDAESIIPNDVPMDGSMALFPKQDMSEIYGKSWNANGTIKTVIYRPITDDSTNNQSNTEKAQIGLSEDDMEAVMKRFDELSDDIEKLGKIVRPISKAKKETGGKTDE